MPPPKALPNKSPARSKAKPALASKARPSRVAKAKAGPTTIDAYLAAQPEATRKLLARVRGAIRKAIPRAEETISYQIPCFKLGGRPVVYFAGWTQHYAIYPATPHVVATLADALAGYSLSKGTIRFPLTEPVPVALIARIAELRAAETEALIARKAASKTR